MWRAEQVELVQLCWRCNFKSDSNINTDSNTDTDTDTDNNADSERVCNRHLFDSNFNGNWHCSHSSRGMDIQGVVRV
jgi:hypothetical protein